MGRTLTLVYGVFSYAVGLLGLVYFMVALSPWELIPTHINAKEPGPLASAITVNILLLLLFAIQHSVMARVGFKKKWTAIIPEPIERSTYVLVSGIVTYAVPYFWQALPGEIWNISNPLLANGLNSLQFVGWAIVVLSSFIINHFELFGLQQVYYHFTQREIPQPKFTDKFLYKIVRHPLQFGLLIGLWSVSRMSMTQFMFSVGFTAYILLGLYFEEKDLVRILGEEYVSYRRRVRMLIPVPQKQ